jgi:hypothetical protein
MVILNEMEIALRKTILSLFLVCLSGDAFAISFRCQGSIIKPGMTKDAVRIQCGDPASQRAFVSTIKVIKNDTEVLRYLHEEVWVFDLGSSIPLKTVHFRGDQVHDVHASKYVGKIAGRQLDCTDNKSPFKSGASMDIVKYLCGDPTAQRLAESSFKKVSAGEKEVKTENWHYGTGDATMLYSFRDQRLQSVTRRF